MTGAEKILPRVFKSEVRQWAMKIGVKVKTIFIQDMRNKWASCSKLGRLCFASDLLKKKKKFRNYVIVHELLHLNIPNHGRLFTSFMNAYVPGWNIETRQEDRVGKGGGVETNE